MRKVDLFSKRQKRDREGEPDVFVYDKLPRTLRTQIVHITRDTIGSDKYPETERVERVYRHVEQVYCREHGLFQLSKHARSKEDAIEEHILNCESVENVLDVVELLFQVIRSPYRKSSDY